MTFGITCGMIHELRLKCIHSDEGNFRPLRHAYRHRFLFADRVHALALQLYFDIIEKMEPSGDVDSFGTPRSVEDFNDCDGGNKDIMFDHLNKAGRFNEGRMKHGCVHYRRRCRIRAPCCNEIFDCRHCHNDVKNAKEKDPSKRHDVPRQKVEKVICSLCNTEQNVQQVCENCGVNMGEYFCAKCKFYDDETSKEQFHCDACGICRVGGRNKFFHCQRCGCCYSMELKKGHPCVENSMRHNCPVCFEYLFDSLKEIAVLRCGHTMHLECLREMNSHEQFTCPMCSKSVCDMSKIWEQLDQEVAATPMPEAYQNKMVWILCNDCGANNEVTFHVVAQKCLTCKSYNTRQTRGCPVSNS